MPPKKKAKKAKSAEPLEPLEHISKAREDAGKRFQSRKKNVNYDLEQNVREIRAILATNKEIFDRCMPFRDESKNPSGYSVQFTRIGFEVVKTLHVNNATKFVTFPQSSEAYFDMKPLMTPPAGLDDLIVFKYMDSPSIFIDYATFFQKTLLLDGDVLEPFLAKLKDHLMDVQVSLGKIEAWVSEPNEIINFLRESFGENVEVPDSVGNSYQTCSCSAGTHAGSVRCMDPSCREPFNRHSSSYGYNGKMCPNYGGGRFSCQRYMTLKEFTNVPGRHETTFSIADAKEQTKLKKFLEFLSVT